MEHDVNSIFDLLTNTGSNFNGIVENLKNYDATTVSIWVIEALNLIYLGEGPPNANTTDCSGQSRIDKSCGFKTLGASDEACLVTAVVVQWIVRFMCKKLMQLMTPESAILNRKYFILPICICLCINV